MIRVYTASKLHMVPFWKGLEKEWDGLVYFHARWLKHLELGIPETPENARRFWVEDLEDVSTSDAVMIYADSPKDQLRGALVEIGHAIANGKPIIVVGDHHSYGSWQYHPNGYNPYFPRYHFFIEWHDQQCRRQRRVQSEPV